MSSQDRPRHLVAREAFLAQWRSHGLHVQRSLAQEMEAGLAAHGGTRLVFAWEGAVAETTTAELWLESGRVANGLAARGLAAGDPIVLQVPNCREGYTLFLAAMRLGLVFVPVVHIYGAAELAYILRQTKARALALPSTWGRTDWPGRLAALGELPDLRLVVEIGPGVLPGAVRYAELAATDAADAPVHAAPRDSICMINFTSGTTSAPKGVMHTHASLLSIALRSPPLEADLRGGPLFRSGPAGHIGAIMVLPRPYLVGDSMIQMDQFEPGLGRRLIERYGANRMSGVPTHMIALLEEGGGRLPPSLRTALLGAQSVPPALMEKLEAMGMRAVRSYGCTEQPCISCGEPSQPARLRTATDGRVSPDNHVRIVDDDGRELPRGAPGEILAVGPQSFAGYLDASLNEAAFTDDGYYRTGDIGVLDAEGCLTIVDRKKDIVVRGGENVSSREVEDILARHPAVLESAVIGWPDERLGERIGAFVMLRPGQELGLAEVQAHFRDAGVARQKTPEVLRIVEEFPRTAAGKVIKPELRRRAKTGG